jgi:choline-phosphate cytidylyltransferase
MEKIPDGTDPNNPVRIYTDGIFDVFHYGHARLLEQVKKMFPYVYLVVGVCGDEDTHREKGATLMIEKERYESVKHCKWADEVVENAPWIPSLEFLNGVKCHYIAHDPAPYRIGDIEDCYAPFKENGRFLATKRTEGVSTTDIIMRIIRDYNVYVERSIIRGAKPEELNISNAKFFAFKINILTRKLHERETNEKSKNNFLLKRAFRKWQGKFI